VHKNVPSQQQDQYNQDVEVYFENVSYQYPKSSSPSLTNINISIEKNKLIAIMGRTGAGKSTLLSMFNGLIPQFFEGTIDGNVWVKEKNTSEVPIQVLVKDVGFVLQDPETQIFGLTVEKDVAFGPSNLAFAIEDIKRNVSTSLISVGLENYAERTPDQLSGGEKQRVAIAGVLALNSSILVFDEPTSELDPLGALTIHKTLRELKKSGDHTIIISTHDPHYVLSEADELWVIDAKKIVFRGKPADFFSRIELSQKFGLLSPEITDLFRALRRENLYKKNLLPVTINSGIDAIKLLLEDHKEIDKDCQFKRDPVLKVRKRIVKIDSLTHRYPSGLVALDSVSLEFNSQDLVAIVGHNGAGKTTLVKHLNGLLRPTEGNILINDDNVGDFEIEELSKKVGYVFQNPDHQIFAPTVHEEVIYGLKNSNLSSEFLEERVLDSLSITGLIDKKDIHPFNLSKGERQKLAIASVIAMKPEIIIIDEPTTGQDWEGSLALMESIRNLRDDGHTVIMITHNMRLVAEYAERVIIMRKGQVHADGEVREILQDINKLYENSLKPTDMALLCKELQDYKFPPDIITVDEMFKYLKKVIR